MRDDEFKTLERRVRQLEALANVHTLLPAPGLPAVRMTRIICMHEWVTCEYEVEWGLKPLVGVWTPASERSKLIRQECRLCGRVRRGR